MVLLCLLTPTCCEGYFCRHPGSDRTCEAHVSGPIWSAALSYTDLGGSLTRHDFHIHCSLVIDEREYNINQYTGQEIKRLNSRKLMGILRMIGVEAAIASHLGYIETYDKHNYQDSTMFIYGY